MSNYTLIGSASTRAGRALWMLEELGVPYEHLGVKPHAEDVTRHYPRGKVPVLLEAGRFDATTVDGLKARGHQIKEMDMTSGLQAIRVQGDGSTMRLLGGADPRREGVVMGE